MPFWIFKRKKSGSKAEDSSKYVVPYIDRKAQLETDLKFLINNFYGITMQLSRVEHKALASEKEISRIDKYLSEVKRIIQKLNKSEPEFTAYWNNFLNTCDILVRDIKRIIPISTFELNISQQKIEEIGRISRSNSSDFVKLLEDLKKKLNKHYKKDFNVKWPQKTSFF